MFDKDYKKKIWNKFGELERLINTKASEMENAFVKRATESESEAKQASRKASEYKNKAQATLIEAQKQLNSITEYVDTIKKTTTVVRRHHTIVSGLSEKSTNLHTEVVKHLDYISDTHNNIEENTGEINRIIEENTDLENRINQIQTSLENAESAESKISTLLSRSNSKKKEIDNLHDEIYGYDIDEEDGEEAQHVEGLKDELESSFTVIKEKIEKLTSELSDSKSSITKGYKDSLNILSNEFKISNQKVKDLLPGALTVGLSSAYGEKKDDELTSYDKLQRSFYWAIGGLISVSLIPVGVDIYLLNNDHDLVEVLSDTPKMVLSILPLYFPVLWLAYSSSKKMSLSKRLIEEYTHKEVLSKTYQGLSEQVNGLKNNSDSEQLRTKLLFNILEISSENPGKLISDYNKSDHPLMDALDKSFKHAKSLEKFGKIPGLSFLVETLKEKSQRADAILVDANDTIDVQLRPEGEKKNPQSVNGENPQA